ncbi:uncharacterized protein UDID_17984 [Ustilago sp. UG-2017a]|nr:uncharacterized protein UDID_17984 [Ustilago sp. UG-2017a]
MTDQDLNSKLDRLLALMEAQLELSRQSHREERLRRAHLSGEETVEPSHSEDQDRAGGGDDSMLGDPNTPTPAPRPRCHGLECSGSRRAPVESMAVVQSPWRPWTPTDSHAKEERAHMRGGAAKKRTKLKEHADGYHSGAREVLRRRSSVEEVDTAQEAQGCQARRRSSVEGVDTAQEDRSGARGPPCTVLDEEGTLWRERAGAVSLATL